MKRLFLSGSALLALMFSESGCGRSKMSPVEPATPGSVPSATPAAAEVPPPDELWKEFNGERALAHVRAQVECGPRPSGSPALQRARDLIVASLQKSGWTVELQEFSDTTPHGTMSFCNVVARFPTEKNATISPGKKVIVGSHYDSKLFSTIAFLGANDGASSTGALLELAQTLSLDPAFARRFELVFFDGEEAIQQFSENDGLYGSRHYAKALRDSGRDTQFQLGLVWDMIGDRELTITLPLDSPREMVQGVFASAEVLQVRNAFRLFDRPIQDDHVPLTRIARIPTLDLIDFQYDAWHTADDTMDKLSASSLQSVGAVTIHYLKQLLR